jgi:hypothetical protein
MHPSGGECERGEFTRTGSQAGPRHSARPSTDNKRSRATAQVGEFLLGRRLLVPDHDCKASIYAYLHGSIVTNIPCLIVTRSAMSRRPLPSVDLSLPELTSTVNALSN